MRTRGATPVAAAGARRGRERRGALHSQGVLAAALLVMALLVPSVASARSLAQVADAITELDLDRAARLLTETNGALVATTVERARLAIYQGDCHTAAILLDAPELAAAPAIDGLREVARGCAGATAGALIHEDPRHGVWLRLQDERDLALAPFVVAAAARARDALARELGVELPRPLRIDLVRDLFSLAAVTGLPLQAAETTGTVGVARWGRVILLSPRATPRGYPWEDTLAHELVHLVVTRASRDRAPLWLQEGVAKRYEARWRDPRPFDDHTDHDRVARDALLEGRALGFDGLGNSLALLPTPELAAAAYSEVASFVGYWEARQGASALRLLFADLRGLDAEDPTPALRSVSGYDLEAWRLRWEQHLRTSLDAGSSAPLAPASSAKGLLEARGLSRRVRLAELLARRGHHAAAESELLPAMALRATEPSLRWRAARAALADGRPESARIHLGELSDVDSAHGGWFALYGRFARELNDRAAEREADAVALAIDPLLEEVACLGHRRLPPVPGSGVTTPASTEAPLPAENERRQLCLAARRLDRR